MTDFQLRIQKGPDPGTNITLTSASLILGRDPMVDITINNSEVSRQHAQLARTLSGYQIQDLGSTNGTYIDGIRLGGETVDLKPGQIIGLGSGVTLLYQEIPAEEEDPLKTVLDARTPPVPFEEPSTEILPSQEQSIDEYLPDEADQPPEEPAMPLVTGQEDEIVVAAYGREELVIPPFEPDVEEELASQPVVPPYDPAAPVEPQIIYETPPEPEVEPVEEPDVQPLVYSWDALPEDATILDESIEMETAEPAPAPIATEPPSEEPIAATPVTRKPDTANVIIDQGGSPKSNNRRTILILATIFILLCCCCFILSIFMFYVGGDILLREMGLILP